MSVNPTVRRAGWVTGGVGLGLAAFVALGFAARDEVVAPFSASIPTRVAPEVTGSMVAEITAPPFVPARIERDHPTEVVVNLEVIEREMEIASGATYNFWTFGGTVPGSFIRVREGDRVVLNLTNAADSDFPRPEHRSARS